MKKPASLRFPDENPVLKLLFLFLVIKILELSRFNMSDFTVKRTYYDFLSFGLPLALLIYLLLNRWSRLKTINQFLTLPQIWLGRIVCAPLWVCGIFSPWSIPLHEGQEFEYSSQEAGAGKISPQNPHQDQ